jgi:hypothetical protein
MSTTPWLPAEWQPPHRVALDTGHHLRPIRADDVDLDMSAVMGSQERLWSVYGKAWGWPPATMTAEQDREDLAHHEDEMVRRASYNYALFDTGETELLGCVYIDPPDKAGADAEISWWVVDWHVGGPVAAALDRFVPVWIAESWPFQRPRYVGIDLSWDDWLARPEARLPADLPVQTGTTHGELARTNPAHDDTHLRTSTPVTGDNA